MAPTKFGTNLFTSFRDIFFYLTNKLTKNITPPFVQGNEMLLTAVVSVAVGHLAADLFPLCDVDCVHRAGADMTGLILKKQHTG